MGVNAETPVSPLPNMCWYVGFRGDERASTDRACLRRVAAPIMSTWAVPTPWQGRRGAITGVASEQALDGNR